MFKYHKCWESLEFCTFNRSDGFLEWTQRELVWMRTSRVLEAVSKNSGFGLDMSRSLTPRNWEKPPFSQQWTSWISAKTSLCKLPLWWENMAMIICLQTSQLDVLPTLPAVKVRATKSQAAGVATRIHSLGISIGRHQVFLSRITSKNSQAPSNKKRWNATRDEENP